MKESLVSIIIPYYNRPKKLARCLNSIASQTYTYHEIIVVDDCSSIPPQKSHGHFKYLKNTVNSGPGASRNHGMQEALGEFIVFLDCDDYWHTHFLETVVGALLSNNNAVMAYALGYNVNDSETIVGKHRNPQNKKRDCLLPNILFMGRAWGTGACLWRANIIKDVKWITARSWEDYAFDAAVAVKNNNIIFVDKRLVYFDVSGDNKLSNQNAKFAAIEKNKSILNISNTLIKSELINDKVIKKSITVLILLSLEKLKRYKVKSFRILINNLKNLKTWQTTRFVLYVLLLCLSSWRISSKYLLRLKKRINKDKLRFLD